MSEISIKKVCCTCLSTDRNLYQLCRILDGINILYTLLTHDPEAYKVKLNTFTRLACHKTFYFEYQSNDIPENFIDCGPAKGIKTESDSDDVPLSILYACDDDDGSNDEFPIIKKYTECSKNIAEIARMDLTHGNNTTTLAENYLKHGYNSGDLAINGLKHGCITAELAKNDLKHGYNIAEQAKDDLKHGYDTAKTAKNDLKLGFNTAELGNNDLKHSINNVNGKLVLNNIFKNESHGFKSTMVLSNETDNEKVLDKRRNERENTEYEKTMEQKSSIKITSKMKNKVKYSKYYSKNIMSEAEMMISMEKRRTDIKNVVFKCDTCLIEFKSENRLKNHVTVLHEAKDNCTQCDICHTYKEDIDAHRQTHYEYYTCVLCTHIAYTHIDIVRHLKRNHREICRGEKKSSRLKKNGQLLGEVSLYPCPECKLSFQNKDMRWKHVQKKHRDGHKCKICDKKFAFKNNLERHERIHQAPLPREECPVCHKMIRTDLLKTHSRIHTHRQSFTCVECDKSFVCRTTYESHLKYAQAHATGDLYRHKCSTCHKGYRSRGELRDHINYQHKGQAEHKCPICGKGLATKRCIRRHVRRAHEGIKECAKDKICQQCGKAFRDKKGLIEHERVHSGARPLECSCCGRAFRQRAALYAHTRRLHPHTTGIGNGAGNG